MSGNHNGSLRNALKIVDLAAKAGADAIKLQTYTPDTMTINSNKNDFIVSGGSIWDGESFYDLYKRAHTPWDWHEKLFSVAQDEGLICFSTPFDKSAVDFLEKLDNPIYKIASFEINDIPLIRYVAQKNKPLILSTGIASSEDIELALETIRKVGKNEIALLKCTSSYPAPIDQANLTMIKDFEKKYGVVAGLSDHTMGNISPIVATTLGAKIIEKHFILDKSIGGPDASFSLDEQEFSIMVKGVRDAEKSIGEVNYNLTQKQIQGKEYSRSLYIVKDVRKGEILTTDNVRSIRPGHGLAPKYLDQVIGKKFKNDFSMGTRLTLNIIYNES